MRALVLTLLAACTPEPLTLVAVSFNTGSTLGLPHDAPPDDGYGAAEAEISDRAYGDGLAWLRAIDDARRFFSALSPDVVGFQEIFHPGACPDIAEADRAGFVCERWKAGDPTVAQEILGPGYQVACHLGKPDKCLGVKRSFAAIAGCAGDLCLDGLAGSAVEGCGSGSRWGKATLELASGDGAITVVNLHGSSGLSAEDMDCRRRQFEAAFGALGAAPNLVLGDFNTDPVRLAGGDPSADAVRELSRAHGLHFVSAVGEDATPSYGGIVNIDHALSDALRGSCFTAGVDPGHPGVTEMVYFDHRPLVCALTDEDSLGNPGAAD